jgi:hypothetical protein
MLIPVIYIKFGQGLVLQDQQILSVLFLGCFRKIERPGDYCFPVDDHDLVMGNGVFVIYEGGNT